MVVTYRNTDIYLSIFNGLIFSLCDFEKLVNADDIFIVGHTVELFPEYCRPGATPVTLSDGVQCLHV